MQNSISKGLEFIFDIFSFKEVNDTLKLEKAKSIVLTTRFCLIGAICIIPFCFIAFDRGESVLGGVLLTVSTLLILNFIYLHYTQNYKVTAITGMLTFALLCVYLILSGGRSGTGPFWVYIFPAVSFYMLGLRLGVVFNLFMLIFTFFALFVFHMNPFLSDISNVLNIRFFCSLSLVSVFAMIYEYTREQTEIRLILMSEKLQRASRTDELTRLPNRRYLKERLSLEITRSERSGLGFAIIICDIDHFKKVNDTYGHACGDLILKAIADRLGKNIRQLDFICRWGGEEFLILLVETVDQQKAEEIAQRMRKDVAKTVVDCDGNSLSVTMSFGIKLYTPKAQIDDCLKQADDCLYEAKNQGRNIVVCAPD